jgi:hypothetical protein
MPIVSFRNNHIPTNSVVFFSGTTLPKNFIHESAPYGRYPKGVANICTNPGTTGGNSTHQHAADCHSHTSCVSHTHTVTTGNSSGSISYNTLPGGSPASTNAHTHNMTSDSNIGSVTSTGNCHQHAASNNSPQHTTYAFIKKEADTPFRNKHLSPCASFMWANTLASIPSGFIKETSSVNRMINSIACSCATPGNGGCANHQHAVSGSHTHTVTLTNHSHTFTGRTGGTESYSGSKTQSSPISVALANHTHGQSLTSCNATTCATSGSSGCHQHDSVSLTPVSVEVVPIKQSSIGFRKCPVPSLSVLMWTGLNACIPSNYQLADGTNCTTDLRGKYLKQITTACTNPGCSVGSNTHQHASAGHCHTTGCLSHTHCIGGSITSDGCAATFSSGVNDTLSTSGHSHTAPSTSAGPSSSSSNTNCDGHTHDSVNHEPLYYEVAWIQKL